MIERLIL
jgi:hypothetical protein